MNAYTDADGVLEKLLFDSQPLIISTQAGIRDGATRSIPAPESGRPPVRQLWSAGPLRSRQTTKNDGLRHEQAKGLLHREEPKPGGFTQGSQYNMTSL